MKHFINKQCLQMNIFCSRKNIIVINILHLFFTVKMSHFLPTIMPHKYMAVVVFWGGVCHTCIVVLWIVVILLNPHIFVFEKKKIERIETKVLNWFRNNGQTMYGFCIACTIFRQVNSMGSRYSRFIL